MPVWQLNAGPVLVVTRNEPDTRHALSAGVVATLHALFCLALTFPPTHRTVCVPVG